MSTGRSKRGKEAVLIRKYIVYGKTTNLSSIFKHHLSQQHLQYDVLLILNKTYQIQTQVAVQSLLDCYNFFAPHEYSEKTFGILAFLLRKSVGTINFSDIIHAVQKQNERGQRYVSTKIVLLFEPKGHLLISSPYYKKNERASLQMTHPLRIALCSID